MLYLIVGSRGVCTYSTYGKRFDPKSNHSAILFASSTFFTRVLVCACGCLRAVLSPCSTKAPPISTRAMTMEPPNDQFYLLTVRVQSRHEFTELQQVVVRGRWSSRSYSRSWFVADGRTTRCCLEHCKNRLLYCRYIGRNIFYKNGAYFFRSHYYGGP